MPEPHDDVTRLPASSSDRGETIDAISSEQHSDPPDRLAELVECWRCGKAIAQLVPTCPYCHATNRHAPLPDTQPELDAGTARQSKQIVVVMCVFIAMLGCGIVHGAVTRMAIGDAAEIGPQLARTILHSIMTFEVVSTVLVVAGLVVCGRIESPNPPSNASRILAWLFSIPLLGAAMAANLAYHQFVNEFVGVPIIEDELLKQQSLFGLIVVLYCVQPAIVEELFSRYMFLGVLRQHLQTHSAVWISALAFGLLHLASPLSIPYLIALGALLGYLRIASGSLVLPILFHFAHNAAVIAIELRT